MWNDKVVLREVNSVNKIICFILFLSTVIFIQYPWFLLLFDIAFLLLTEEYKYLKKIAYGSVIIGLLCVLFPLLLWINKFICVVLYIGLILKLVRLEQVKYLVELLCYQLQNTKITSNLITGLYLLRLMKKNYQKKDQTRKSYGLKKNIHFVITMIKQAYLDSSRDVKEIVLIHKLRFYNLYPRRTYMSHPSWERWDTYYLMSHLLILIIAVIIGR